MRERVIECRHTGGIVSDRDDLPQAQTLDNRFKVAQLLLKAIDGAGRLVRGAKTQEIERHNATSACGEVRDQIVPDMQVVGEAVHEHEGRPGARIISSVETSFRPRDTVFGELTGIRRHTSSFLPRWKRWARRLIAANAAKDPPLAKSCKHRHGRALGNGP